MQKEKPPPTEEGNEEEKSLEDLDSIESHSNSTLIDLEIEKKGEEPQMEQVESRRKKKKMKADINENTINLDSEYMKLMTEVIVEVAQTSFKTIEERHE